MFLNKQKKHKPNADNNKNINISNIDNKESDN